MAYALLHHIRLLLVLAIKLNINGLDPQKEAGAEGGCWIWHRRLLGWLQLWAAGQGEMRH